MMRERAAVSHIYAFARALVSRATIWNNSARAQDERLQGKVEKEGGK